MAVHVINEANRCLNCKKPMCMQACPIHTGLELAKALVMLFLFATTALLIRINQGVVGNIDFISAITNAMPDNTFIGGFSF